MATENRIFYVLLTLALIAVGHTLYVASGVWIWLICSFFLFALTEPWLKRFTDRGFSPAYSALMIVLIATTILSALAFLMFKTSAGLFTQMLSYKSAIREMYVHTTTYMNDWLHGYFPADAGQTTETVQTTVNTSNPAAPISNTIGTGILSGINSMINVMVYAVLTPLLTFFMIAERELFASVFFQIIKDETKGKLIIKQISDAINAYFFGNFVLILMSFPVFCISFWIIGVKSFLTLSLLSAIFNLVPFLGFFFAAALPAIDLFMNSGSMVLVIILVSTCFLTHFIIANVVTPKLLGSKVDLNATTATIALVAWGGLWGAIGFLIAIPVTAIIKILCQHSNHEVFQWCAGLMSENPRSLHLQAFSFIKKRLPVKKESP